MRNCSCGREKPYLECCHLIHEGTVKAATAEDLMRSRYTAFTLANGDYLMKSHHPDTRNPKDKMNLEKWAKSVNWIKLEILNRTNGLEFNDRGTVEFKAFYFENRQIQVIHENSEFVKENSLWYYVGIVSN